MLEVKLNHRETDFLKAAVEYFMSCGLTHDCVITRRKYKFRIDEMEKLDEKLKG
jgi:hypothetical protein